MKQFRHELHIKSPKLKQIAEAVAKHGHYYFDRTQKRKPTGYKRNGSYIIIEGDILVEIGRINGRLANND